MNRIWLVFRSIFACFSKWGKNVNASNFYVCIFKCRIISKLMLIVNDTRKKLRSLIRCILILLILISLTKLTPLLVWLACSFSLVYVDLSKIISRKKFMLAYILLKLQNILQQFERRLNEWIMNVCRQDRLKYKKAKRGHRRHRMKKEWAWKEKYRQLGREVERVEKTERMQESKIVECAKQNQAKKCKPVQIFRVPAVRPSFKRYA